MHITKEDKIMFLEGVPALLIALLIFVVLYPFYLNNNTVNKNIKAFKNSEVLVCYNTLIVSDANWKLADNHLINNNSAGYLSIDNCQIKKETK